ncbi:MAG: hypothetical protein ACRC0F_00265 [Cetobacterium sp.]
MVTKIKKLKTELSGLRTKVNKLVAKLEDEGRNPHANNDYRFLQQNIAKVKSELLTMETQCREIKAKRLERNGVRDVVTIIHYYNER